MGLGVIMYYVEDGQIKSDDFDGNWDLGMSNSDILGFDDYVGLSADNYDNLSDISSVSSGDASGIYSYDNAVILSTDAYNDLIDTLSLISNPSIYPNSNSLSVFLDVLNSYDYNTYYFIVAGSSSSDVYMYTGDSYDFNGNTLYLSGNTKVHYYYTYRPTSSSSTQYLYTVSNTNNPSINFNNTLIYTNCVPGYPDIIPHTDQKLNLSVICIVVLFFAIVPKIIKRRVSKND